MYIAEVAHFASDLLAAAPDPGGGKQPPGTEAIVTLLQWVKWLFTAAAVAGGMIIGGKMVLSHRRGNDAGVSALGFWLAGCVLAGAAPHLVDALV